MNVIRVAAVPASFAATAVSALTTSATLLVADRFHLNSGTPAQMAYGFVLFLGLTVVPLFLIVLAYGVPTCASPKRLRAASSITTALFGALPGAAWSSWVEHQPNLPFLVGGISSALTYHCVHRQISSAHHSN
jgi:hypothetical protein